VPEDCFKVNGNAVSNGPQIAD